MKTRRIISILLSVCMLLSIAGIAASAATAADSAASGNLSVAATSNFGASATQTVNNPSDKVTVTYYVNVADAQMVNFQWTLTYDSEYLEFDETDGVNVNFDNGEVDSYNMMPFANGSIVINYERENEILGNTSNLSKFALTDNGSKVALVSVTFIPKKEGSTTVNLDVEVAQIYKGTATDETNLFYDSELVDTDVTLNAEAEITVDGEEEEAIEDANICKFSAYNVAFDNSLALNYFVSKDMYESLTDVRVEFQREGSDQVVTVTEPTYYAANSRYGFAYKNIYPQLVVDDVTATLYARYNGVLYKATSTKSVKTYAMNNVAKSTVSAANKKVYVDVLNYAAAVQTVQNYKKNNLANADLTDAQKAYGTQGNPTLTSIKGYVDELPNASLTWTGMACRLEDSVAVRFKFTTTQNINDVVIKFSIGNRGVVGEYTAADFEDAGNGAYYVYFDKAFANEFSDKIIATAYDKNGNKISRSYKYSIESYAQSQVTKSTVDANTKAMLNAMMNYGNAVVVASGHTVVTD